MKKKILALTLAIAMVMGLAACGGGDKGGQQQGSQGGGSSQGGSNSGGSGAPSSPYTVQICGATSGGTYFLIANGLCQLMKDTMPEWFRASAQSTGGTPENIRLMESGETDFAFGQAGVVKTALETKELVIAEG